MRKRLERIRAEKRRYEELQQLKSEMGDYSEIEAELKEAEERRDRARRGMESTVKELEEKKKEFEKLVERIASQNE